MKRKDKCVMYELISSDKYDVTGTAIQYLMAALIYRMWFTSSLAWNIFDILYVYVIVYIWIMIVTFCDALFHRLMNVIENIYITYVEPINHMGFMPLSSDLFDYLVWEKCWFQWACAPDSISYQRNWVWQISHIFAYFVFKNNFIVIESYPPFVSHVWCMRSNIVSFKLNWNKLICICSRYHSIDMTACREI